MVALRTAAVTALAAPPLGLFVLGLLLTASRPQPRLLVTGAVVLAVLVLLLLRSNRIGAAVRRGHRRRPTPRPSAWTWPPGAATRCSAGSRSACRRWPWPTVLAVAATWLLPVDGSTRRDPRALREQTVQLTDALSPLAQLRPQLTGPPAPLFTVTVSAVDPSGAGSAYRPDRVRTAALGEFDGALWTGSDRFSVTGSTLPGFVPLDGTPVRFRYRSPSTRRSTRRRARSCRSVGEPVRFGGTDFAFDRDTVDGGPHLDRRPARTTT